MNHYNVVSTFSQDIQKEFKVRIAGQYYTNKKIVDIILKSFFQQDLTHIYRQEKLKIIDPFAGDGRLITWFIEQWIFLKLPSIKWDIYLIDLDTEGLEIAKNNLQKMKEIGIDLNIYCEKGDTFKLSKKYIEEFDVVLTNPPWELLKPDYHELKELNNIEKDKYIFSLKDYDTFLSKEYPLSQPKNKFAGWGTNLSRVGLEVSYNLCKKNGYMAIILPASFFADEQSLGLRKEIFLNCKVEEIFYYPAEAKLFGKADIVSSAFLAKKSLKGVGLTKLTLFDKNMQLKSSSKIELTLDDDRNFLIPISLGGDAIKVLKKMKRGLNTWEELEKKHNEFWAGRELDETRSKEWLVNNKELNFKFIKGRMIHRYKIVENPSMYINKENWKPSKRVSNIRIAWRDVSRQSQKRRLISMLIPKNVVAGNSLNTVVYNDNDESSMYALLGIMNSLCFEFQLKCYLSTSHISLSAIRKVCIPQQKELKKFTCLIAAVKNKLQNIDTSEALIEAIVAKKIYNLNKKELFLVLNTYDKLSIDEKENIINEYEYL